MLDFFKNNDKLNTLTLFTFFCLVSPLAKAHVLSFEENPLLIPMLIMAANLAALLIYLVKLRRSKTQLQRSQNRIKRSIEASGDLMWDWCIKKGEVIRSQYGTFEHREKTLVSPPNRLQIHPSDLNSVEYLLEKHLSGQYPYFEASYRIKDAEGDWVWVLDRGKVIEFDKSKKPVRMTGTVKNISRLKKAEDRLNLFARCVENISDAIVIYNKDLKLIDFNPAFQKQFIADNDNVIGRALSFTSYSEAFNKQVKLDVAENGHWAGEVKIPTLEQERVPFQVLIDTIKDKQQQVSHYIVVYSDLTERKRAEKDLHKLTNSDSLTGLPNRNLFFTNLKKLVANKTRLALLVLDLDNFKKVNDSLGHQMGDLLLCHLVQRLTKLLRNQDSLYRLGGDELALIIEGTNDIHTITSMAKKFLATISQPISLVGHELVITSSVGIVLYPEDGNTPQNLLKNADTAMYHAKQTGNRYLFFNDSMNLQAVKRLQIENLIRFGLNEDHFCVYYQPKMDLNTGQINGMEALVRFVTPKKGMISPASFIPVAEETGQIIDIGEVVLHKACADVKRWVDAGLFDHRVAVNLSPRQFALPDLSERIDHILDQYKLDAHYLELEITEGSVMNSPKDAIATMQALRNRGIQLAMDDFGTGYSSLAYLKQFPLNTLKIDKAFVDDMNNEKGRKLIDSIVTIAQNLELSVVAEGVEELAQVEQLKPLKCETIQGYYYSKPLCAEDFEQFLIDNQSQSLSMVRLA